MTGPGIYREVLENLKNGVLVSVGARGQIETFNPSATHLLGLDAGEAKARGLAEVFVLRDGLDDLTRVLTDPTMVGAEAGCRSVRIEDGGKARLPLVVTSRLKRGEGDPETGAVTEWRIEVGTAATDSMEDLAGLKLDETIRIPGG